MWVAVCVCVFSRKICAKRRNWNELKGRRSTAINSPRPFAFDVIANTHSLFSVDTLHNVRVAVGSSDSSEAQTSSQLSACSSHVDSATLRYEGKLHFRVILFLTVISNLNYPVKYKQNNFMDRYFVGKLPCRAKLLKEISGSFMLSRLIDAASIACGTRSV